LERIAYQQRLAQAKIDRTFQTPLPVGAWYARRQEQEFFEFDILHMVMGWLPKFVSCQYLDPFWYREEPLWLLCVGARKSGRPCGPGRAGADAPVIPLRLHFLTFCFMLLLSILMRCNIIPVCQTFKFRLGFRKINSLMAPFGSPANRVVSLTSLTDRSASSVEPRRDAFRALRLGSEGIKNATAISSGSLRNECIDV
jgi:hypothetical protein